VNRARRPRGVTVKTPAQVALMRAAGLVVARTLDRLAAAVRPGLTTGALDALAEASIRGEDAVPSFLGYHGFTGSICASVGPEVVHGIPRLDRVLEEGELVSIDCGAILHGWHGDAAITVPVGDCAPDLLRLSEVTERSLWAGLAAARDGGRLSDIGAAVEAVVVPHGYGLVEGYTGHGIGTSMHEPPYVPNTAPEGPGRGMALTPGIVLAVEPMVTLGNPEVTELPDGWTVVTLDGLTAAHWEHTVAVTADGPWVLTALDGGVSGLAQAAVSGVTAPRTLDPEGRRT
jgi:methionine aminopeptidase type I